LISTERGETPDNGNWDREAAICGAYLDGLPDGHTAAFGKAAAVYAALFDPLPETPDADLTRFLAAALPGCLGRHRQRRIDPGNRAGPPRIRLV
jgi:hypothetical protein